MKKIEMQEKINQHEKTIAEYEKVLYEIKSKLWGRESYTHQINEIPEKIEIELAQKQTRISNLEKRIFNYDQELEWMRRMIEALAVDKDKLPHLRPSEYLDPTKDLYE